MQESNRTPAAAKLSAGLQKVKALQQRAVRRRRGQALIEGPQAVRELLRYFPREVRAVYFSKTAASRHSDVLELAGRALPPDLVRSHLTEAEADAVTPDAQGVFAVLRTDRGPAASTLDQVTENNPRLVAVLAQGADPGNVGTIIRTSDAAGADAVVLASGSVEHTNPKVLRSTAGSIFHLPVVADVDLAPAIAELRAAGIQILAADVRGAYDLDELADAAARSGVVLDANEIAPGAEDPAEAIRNIDLRRPTAWLFGNEAHGLSEDELALADGGVRVPIHGHAESLNVAIAAALCLYASARAQRGAVHGRAGESGEGQ